MSNTSKLLLAVCAVVIVLHIWGALKPAHENWGTHLFAFYTPLVGIAALVVAGLLMIPSTQSKILGMFERFVRMVSSLPLLVSFLLLVSALIGGIYLLPVKLHLLGDGAILLRSIHQTAAWGNESDELVRSFRNQPFMRVIYQWAMQFHSTDGSTMNPHDVYLSLDIFSAIIFMVVLFWFARKLDRQPVERVLLGLFLFFAAGSQFFFGYVENYVLLYVATVLYAITGWLTLDGKVSVLVPILCWVAMAGSHLGALVFGPSILVLIYWKMRGDTTRLLLVSGGLAILGVVFFYMIGFNPGDLLRHLSQGSVDFLQPFTATSGNFPYAMFSLVHLMDWLNASLLVAPFGIGIVAVLLVVQLRTPNGKTPALIFLTIAACCGLIFTWIINSGVGLARDWDLLASFFMPMVVLEVYLLSHLAEPKPRRYLLVVVVALTLLHWGAWIGINASADRHLQRVKMLGSPGILSYSQQIVFDEALANFYFDNGNYREARTYYEHFISIENTNPRITGNIADVYRKLGEKDKYFAMLKRAVELKSRDPGIYSNLGVEYAGRGDTVKAIEFNERAVAIDSNQRLAHANLGILYTNTRKYALAKRHFASAIALGMREPVLFRYAGDVCVVQNEYPEALEYYRKFLELVPSDQRVRGICEQLQQSIKQRIQ